MEESLDEIGTGARIRDLLSQCLSRDDEVGGGEDITASQWKTNWTAEFWS